MPRKGRGQKVQAVRGQQYGQAKMQEDSQTVVPLPSIEDSESMVPTMRAGEKPFSRMSERPSEPVGEQGYMPSNTMDNNVLTKRQQTKIVNLLPMLERMASDYDSSPKMRSAVMQARRSVSSFKTTEQEN
jgi:hypothetical protein